MAALTFVATISADRVHTVTRDTSDGIGAGVAALIVDNTKTKLEISAAISALLTAWDREASKASLASGISTSGSSKE